MRCFSRITCAATISACFVLGLSGCIIVAVDEDGSGGAWSSRNSRSKTIGVHLSEVSHATAAQAGIDGSRACVVTDVWANSAAERGGLRKWDVITAIDGKDWATTDALRDAIRSRHGGDALRLSVVRAGQPTETTVIIPGE